MLTATCDLRMPGKAHFCDQIARNAPWAIEVAELHSHAGQSLVLCGAGPTLAHHLDRMATADAVWACNSALPYLWDIGVRVTHGIAIDQGEGMLAEHEFGRALPVDYYLASSVHPELVRHLARAGRRMTFFHSFLGVDNPEGWAHPDGLAHEEFCYRRLYRPTVLVGSGVNVVPRAIGLAMALGFASVEVIGADCAARPAEVPPPPPSDPTFGEWVGDLVLYADGRTAGAYGLDGPIASACIDGRWWSTRPDMLMSARHMLELADLYPGRITFTGDTLVNALAAQPLAYREGLPELTATGQMRNLAVAAR